MSLSPPRTVPIAALGPTNAGATLFRQGGKLHVSCVLKATFQLVPDAPMKSVAPEELFAAETNHFDNPNSSVRATSDMVPYLPRVDVVMTGHAYARAGKPVNRQPVRLAIFHTSAVLDKTLHVYGDHDGAEFLPFERIPLMYERARGAVGDPENPYGTGKTPGSRLPNIVDPRNRNAVAGFAPISRAHPQRKALRGTMSIAAFEEPIAEFPPDFDWCYFQSAPADQQLPSLVGNEWIVLEGVHPQLPRVTSRLPSIRPIAVVIGIDPDDPQSVRAIQLRIDILRIDADKLRCSVVSRGVVQLEDDRALATVRIAGAVETDDKRYAHMLVPESPRRALDGAIMAATLQLETDPRKAAYPKAAMTLVPEEHPRTDKVMPFIGESSRGPSQSPAIPIPGAPWSQEPIGKAHVVASVHATTMTLELQPVDTSASIPIPPAPPLVDSENIVEIPLDILPAPAQPVVQPVEPPPPTIVFDSPSPVTAPAPAPAPSKPAPTKDIWAPSPEPPIEPANPAPRPLPAKPSVKNAIYGSAMSKKKG